MRTQPHSRLTLSTAEYLLYGLEGIEGWGIDSYLAKLFLTLDRFQQDGKVFGNLLEIGVHHGRTAILLALMANLGEVAVFVDLFGRQQENVDASGRGDREIFEGNLNRWAKGKPTQIVQANSIELDFTTIPDLAAGVRFAHIDGAHYRDAVMNDIEKTRAVLCDRGIVVIDDFSHTGFPGVNEACNAYLESNRVDGLAPVAIGHNKLVLTTQDAQAELADRLRSGLPHITFPSVRFHRYDVVCLDSH